MLAKYLSINEHDPSMIHDLMNRIYWLIDMTGRLTSSLTKLRESEKNWTWHKIHLLKILKVTFQRHQSFIEWTYLDLKCLVSCLQLLLLIDNYWKKYLYNNTTIYCRRAFELSNPRKYFYNIWNIYLVLPSTPTLMVALVLQLQTQQLDGEQCLPPISLIMFNSLLTCMSYHCLNHFYYSCPIIVSSTIFWSLHVISSLK